jgi:hypothetical protein
MALKREGDEKKIQRHYFLTPCETMTGICMGTHVMVSKMTSTV